MFMIPKYTTGNGLSPGRAVIIRGSKLDRKAEKRKRREEQLKLQYVFRDEHFSI